MRNVSLSKGKRLRGRGSEIKGCREVRAVRYELNLLLFFASKSDIVKYILGRGMIILVGER
jgi:hypothetical protein